jgi:peroxiredoxin
MRFHTARGFTLAVFTCFCFILAGCSPAPSLPDEAPKQDLPADNYASASAIPAETVASPAAKQATPTGGAEDIETIPATPPTLMDLGALPPVSPEVGGLAPDLSLTTLNEENIQISQLRGKYLLINYWVTWCIPCMDELPALDRVSRDYQAENVVILTVNGTAKDKIDDITRVVNDLQLTNPILLDKRDEFWKAYHVQFLPTSFLIDNNGVIRYIIRGSATEEVIREKLDLLVSGQL